MTKAGHYECTSKCLSKTRVRFYESLLICFEIRVPDCLECMMFEKKQTDFDSSDYFKVLPACGVSDKQLKWIKQVGQQGAWILFSYLLFFCKILSLSPPHKTYLQEIGTPQLDKFKVRKTLLEIGRPEVCAITEGSFTSAFVQLSMAIF